MMASQEQHNLETVKKLLQGFKTGNTDQVDALVRDDYTDHFAEDGLRDKAGFKKMIGMVHSAFAQFDPIELTPAILFAKDDMVAMMP